MKKYNMVKEDLVNKTVEFIKDLYEFKAKPEKDVRGLFVVGYNTVVPHVVASTENETVTLTDAFKYLYEHVSDDYEKLKNWIKNHRISMSFSQVVSTLSLIYNIGYKAFKNSEVAQFIIHGEFKKAGEAFLNYFRTRTEANLIVSSKELYNIRVKEKELFESDSSVVV